MGNTSPLRKAILENDTATLEQILQDAGEGAPDLINEDYTSDCLFSRSRNVQSPLHSAISKRKPDCAELLLKYGAEVNQDGLWGMTALHMAARYNDLRMLKTCLDFQAELYPCDHEGRKPIHQAANTGSMDTLKYLLEEVGQPEDVNIQDRQKRTPLHEAARWGRLPAVEYLCEKGADIAATSTRGHTPQQEAENNMKRDTAEYLRGRKEKT